MKFLFSLILACMVILVFSRKNVLAESVTEEKTPLETFLAKQTGSENVDQAMKTIFVEFLKANNLTNYKEAQVFLGAQKRLFGCRDSCCKRKWGICYRWCWRCSGGIGK